MQKYIIIKELPDASVGTEVYWDLNINSYVYKKSAYVSPNDTNYLTAGQVTQNCDFFCKCDEYPEYYAYKYPVYSREEILGLLKDSFEKRTSSQIMTFENKLRELGKLKAKKILNK